MQFCLLFLFSFTRLDDSYFRFNGDNGCPHAGGLMKICGARDSAYSVTNVTFLSAARLFQHCCRLSRRDGTSRIAYYVPLAIGAALKVPDGTQR